MDPIHVDVAQDSQALGSFVLVSFHVLLAFQSLSTSLQACNNELCLLMLTIVLCFTETYCTNDHQYLGFSQLTKPHSLWQRVCMVMAENWYDNCSRMSWGLCELHKSVCWAYCSLALLINIYTSMNNMKSSMRVVLWSEGRELAWL